GFGVAARNGSGLDRLEPVRSSAGQNDHDPIPTKKDRRLVFIEYVELAAFGDVLSSAPGRLYHLIVSPRALVDKSIAELHRGIIHHFRIVKGFQFGVPAVRRNEVVCHLGASKVTGPIRRIGPIPISPAASQLRVLGQLRNIPGLANLHSDAATNRAALPWPERLTLTNAP